MHALCRLCTQALSLYVYASIFMLWRNAVNKPESFNLNIYTEWPLRRLSASSYFSSLYQLGGGGGHLKSFATTLLKWVPGIFVHRHFDECHNLVILFAYLSIQRLSRPGAEPNIFCFSVNSFPKQRSNCTLSNINYFSLSSLFSLFLWWWLKW